MQDWMHEWLGVYVESVQPVHDDELHVDVFAVLVQKIRHEIGHRLVRNVPTQHDVSTDRSAIHRMSSARATDYIQIDRRN